MCKYVIECKRVFPDEVLISVYADGLKNETIETYSYIDGLNLRYSDLSCGNFAAVADAVYYGL